MGNYSYIKDNQLEFNSLEDQHSYCKTIESHKELKTTYKEAFDHTFLKGSKPLAFLDGTKLDGYWYSSTCKLLLEVAPFIKGSILFEEETGIFFTLYFDGRGNITISYAPEGIWDIIREFSSDSWGTENFKNMAKGDSQ